MMSNPWISRRVLCYAHRGGALEAPSSTVFAVERAIFAGASAIEIDVHPTKDLEAVCLHDDSVERTTDGSGNVRDLTLEEIRGLDAAYYFGNNDSEEDHQLSEDAYPYRGLAKEDPKFRVPTLKEVVEAAKNTFLNIDIKEDLGSEAEFEAKVVSEIVERDLIDSTIFASFLQAPLDRIRDQFPELYTAASPEEALHFYNDFLADRHRPETLPLPYVALQIPGSYGGIEYLDASFVEFAHDCGVAVHVWTINERSQMEHLVEVGVDGIITDRSSICATTLSDLKVAYQP
ncbi:glycerophosphoryl diester phosphodiesterase [Ferrithrix thermotolerans DSM 19514]|uniref:Glycerophosphoryl diester phosphodiesterase n=2 Tax=Ferrithrix TaxID=643949 RepID=A0A1M4XUW0_9ACTN|nr:glycerophosphoryl diester phosphodiesterase [Ferrithrix thermotolerans DSM 19514]